MGISDNGQEAIEEEGDEGRGITDSPKTYEIEGTNQDHQESEGRDGLNTRNDREGNFSEEKVLTGKNAQGNGKKNSQSQREKNEIQMLLSSHPDALTPGSHFVR